MQYMQGRPTAPLTMRDIDKTHAFVHPSLRGFPKLQESSSTLHVATNVRLGVTTPTPRQRTQSPNRPLHKLGMLVLIQGGDRSTTWTRVCASNFGFLAPY